MRYGSKAYKAWLKTLVVGSKVTLAGKHCPENERGVIRDVKSVYGDILDVRCLDPIDGSGCWDGTDLDRWTFIDGIFDSPQYTPRYYLMPVPEATK